MRPKDPFFSLFLKSVKAGLISQGDRILVGVSGGQDSVALLHLLLRIQKTYNLQLAVAHLNHQLRPSAPKEEDFVANLADRYGLPFFSQKTDINALAQEKKISIEAAARNARRDFFIRTALNWSAVKVALGHTSSDQVETVLMRLIRGSGSRGLSGMAQRNSLQKGIDIIRPLLVLSREDTERYCKFYHLDYCTDESNESQNYFRNWIRHSLIPLLYQKNPSIHDSVYRLSQNLSEEAEALDWMAQKLALKINPLPTPEGFQLHRKHLSQYPLVLKKRILELLIHRYFGQNLNLSREKSLQIDHLVTLLKGENVLTLSTDLEVILRYNQILIRKKIAPLKISSGVYPLQIPGKTSCPAFSFIVQTKSVPAASIDARKDQSSRHQYYLNLANAHHLVFRCRQKGDKLFGHKKKLKELLIEKKVPRSQRDFLPMLVTEKDQVLWIPGYFQARQNPPQNGDDSMIQIEIIREN